MITLNSKLEQILISSFGKKIVLEMQEHILEKNHLLSFRPIIWKVIRKMFIFSQAWDKQKIGVSTIIQTPDLPI